jgi:eukaryotic-like serine/threonine-protein kinase
MVEGDQITPELKLVRSLGRTGISRVWQARDAKLEQDVVVKVLDKPLPRHSPHLHRFQREAEVAAHIKSAHVAHVLGHGTTTTGLPYLQMELLEGEDLASRVMREGPLSLPDVARLVSQVARGLGKAHMLGLVHRNLRPTNVFLSSAAEGGLDAKVLDVGLSSTADFATGGRIPTGATADMAPPEFASPEQVFGVKEVDFRADLWATAVIAYWALTGKTPFQGKNVQEFSKTLEAATFEPPSAKVPSLPAAVDVWFAKAFQRDPAARFGGAKELADEFVRAAGIDPHERLARASVVPGLAGHRARMASGLDLPAQRDSMTGLAAAGDGVKIIPVPRTGRKSSVLFFALLAIVGLGTVIAGLKLLHG